MLSNSRSNSLSNLQSTRKSFFRFATLLTLFLTLSGNSLNAQIAIEISSTERSPHAKEIQSSLADQYQSLWTRMSDDAKQGYRLLTESVYLPADFDESVITAIDSKESRWPLADVSLEPNNRLSNWLAHGISPRPDDASLPLQYVVTNDGRYVMNCFACHGGNLFGSTYPGAPNTTYALETLTEQVRRTKIAQSKKLTHMDVGSMFMPLGTSNGTSNAVMFGVALMNFRDAELNVHLSRPPAEMTHHDMDAPPWWHFYRKHHIYIDGFAQKGHRGLMQFILVRENGPEHFKKWENDFRKVYAFLSELRAPKYPLEVDARLAENGRKIFDSNCARCHGTYGVGSRYPELVVSIDEVGTDRIRLDALSATHRSNYGKSWFAEFGDQKTYSEVDGYVAPPLDGVWASTPYLHNGSVPTLWHLLHPESRPVVWRRIGLALDELRIGLNVEELSEVPSKLKSSDRRWYFDTKLEGKSAQGHDFPASLSEEAKSAVLEYLKTL